MGTYTVALPERVVRRAGEFVTRSGLYPDIETLVSEASTRFLISARGNGAGIGLTVRAYKAESWGRDVRVEVRMPDSTHSELSRLSEEHGANLFAVAVLAQIDRLYRIS